MGAAAIEGSSEQMSKNPVRLWLDDLRSAPNGWTRALSVNAAIEVIEARTVSIWFR